MADNNNSRSSTLTAYGFKREGRKSGRWLVCGAARAEGQVIVPIRVRLDRLPIGFTGGVLLMPRGRSHRFLNRHRAGRGQPMPMPMRTAINLTLNLIRIGLLSWAKL